MYTHANIILTQHLDSCKPAVDQIRPAVVVIQAGSNDLGQLIWMQTPFCKLQHRFINLHPPSVRNLTPPLSLQTLFSPEPWISPLMLTHFANYHQNSRKSLRTFAMVRASFTISKQVILGLLRCMGSMKVISHLTQILNFNWHNTKHTLQWNPKTNRYNWYSKKLLHYWQR